MTWYRRALSFLWRSWVLFRDHSCILYNGCFKELLIKSSADLNLFCFHFFPHPEEAGPEHWLSRNYGSLGPHENSIHGLKFSGVFN